jgi:hypothetical protein
MLEERMVKDDEAQVAAAAERKEAAKRSERVLGAIERMGDNMNQMMTLMMKQMEKDG